jgi:hypothetical protein
VVVVVNEVCTLLSETSVQNFLPSFPRVKRKEPTRNHLKKKTEKDTHPLGKKGKKIL